MGVLARYRNICQLQHLGRAKCTRVLFSLGLPAGAAGIVKISCEIAVIFDILIHTYFSVEWSL